MVVTDSAGDVGKPIQLGSVALGWDLLNVRLAYESSTDLLFVGIDCAGEWKKKNKKKFSKI